MAAVNTFISTLSKSLQDACDKSFKFDSEIEINGNICLNIDKVNKLNFVLNEQILRQSLAVTCVSQTSLDNTNIKEEKIDGTTVEYQNAYLFDESKDRKRNVQLSQSAIGDQGLADTSADFPEDCDDDSLTLHGPKLPTKCDDVAKKESFSQRSESKQGKYLTSKMNISIC